jgi:hypothetical protein
VILHFLLVNTDDIIHLFAIITLGGPPSPVFLDFGQPLLNQMGGTSQLNVRKILYIIEYGAE